MSDALATDLDRDGLDGEIALRLPVRHREVTVVGAEDRALSVVGALVAAGAVVTVVSPRDRRPICSISRIGGPDHVAGSRFSSGRYRYG